VGAREGAPPGRRRGRGRGPPGRRWAHAGEFRPGRHGTPGPLLEFLPRNAPRMRNAEERRGAPARVLAEERRDAGLLIERAQLVAERARRAEPVASGGEGRVINLLGSTTSSTNGESGTKEQTVMYCEVDLGV
jgi:hypothetical protein